MKNFTGIYAYIYRLNTKIGLTMLCLSGFELYSSWVPLVILHLHYLLNPQQNRHPRKEVKDDVNIPRPIKVRLLKTG